MAYILCVLQQFIGAVEYCHQHLVAHRYAELEVTLK